MRCASTEPLTTALCEHGDLGSRSHPWSHSARRPVPRGSRAGQCPFRSLEPLPLPSRAARPLDPTCSRLRLPAPRGLAARGSHASRSPGHAAPSCVTV
jgi:hypothetical protein